MLFKTILAASFTALAAAHAVPKEQRSVQDSVARMERIKRAVDASFAMEKRDVLAAEHSNLARSVEAGKRELSAGLAERSTDIVAALSALLGLTEVEVEALLAGNGHGLTAVVNADISANSLHHGHKRAGDLINADVAANVGDDVSATVDASVGNAVSVGADVNVQLAKLLYNLFHGLLRKRSDGPSFLIITLHMRLADLEQLLKRSSSDISASVDANVGNAVSADVNLNIGLARLLHSLLGNLLGEN
ncbi:hypothetical protein JCM21900_005430 [Sporobolomyces salmonicolor]